MYIDYLSLGPATAQQGHLVEREARRDGTAGRPRTYSPRVILRRSPARAVGLRERQPLERRPGFVDRRIR